MLSTLYIYTYTNNQLQRVYTQVLKRLSQGTSRFKHLNIIYSPNICVFCVVGFVGRLINRITMN